MTAKKRDRWTPRCAVWLVICFALCLSVTGQAQQISKYQIIRVAAEGVLNEKGDLKMSVNWKFPTSADYLNVKRLYPSPYILFRELFSGRASFLVENPAASYNDAASSVAMSGIYRGAAVYRRRLWELDMGKDMEVAWQDNQRIVLIQPLPLGSYFVLGRFKVVLPAKASNVKYSSDSGLITYSLSIPAAPGRPIFDVELKCKPRVMSSAYKVYGSRELGNGAYWVAKAIFKNTGKSNMRELQVSYKLGEYSDWSEPSFYAVVPPGGTVVDLYYPIISAKVAELRTQAPVDVQVRFTYKDESGHAYAETDAKRISILGINQFEFSNILPDENTGTWMDNFSNAPLVAAYATRLDDPVKTFAGLASQFAGGVAASSDDEQAVAFCKAVYDLELAHGISYQTPSGFLTEYTAGQDLKFPRDVLRDKAGTCIDLAILYASTCQAVGLKAYIVLIPGHAYPLINLPSGQILPVETTGVGGAARGKAASFEEAVKIAQKNLPKDLNEKPHYLIDLEEMWRQGVTNPELPRLDADILQKWGYRLPVAQAAAPQAQAAAPTQAQAQVQPPQPTLPVEPCPPEPQPPVPPAPGGANVSGTYRGLVRIAKGPTPGQGYATIVLQQTGTSVQGQFRFDPPGQGYGPIQGQVQGNQLTFTLFIGGVYYQFQGVIQGNSIGGKFASAQTGEEGEFYMEKAATP